jgi:hypothetical protein
MVKASLPVCPSQRSKEDSRLTTTWANSLTATLARSRQKSGYIGAQQYGHPTGKEQPDEQPSSDALQLLRRSAE